MSINNYFGGGLGLAATAGQNALADGRAMTESRTMMERLNLKKIGLEFTISKAQSDLETVNKAIKKLEDNPDLGSILESLGKANVL